MLEAENVATEEVVSWVGGETLPPSIDVTVATKNNSRTVRRCLESIKKNIPFRRIIVVDGGSNDETADIARAEGALVIEEKGKLGRVRFRQAELTNGEWVAIVDSDIYVYPEWWQEVGKCAAPDVGMILGVGRFPGPKDDPYLRYIAWHAGRFGVTAFGNTLVRRDLLLSCAELLKGVDFGEDAVFARYIAERGFRKVFLNKELCFHDQDLLKRESTTFIREGMSIRSTYGGGGAIHILERPYNAIRKWALFSADTGDLSLRVLLRLVSNGVFVAIGFLSAKKD